MPQQQVQANHQVFHTSIVDVPSLKQIRNDHDLKFFEYPFYAVLYLVDYYFSIK